MMLYKIRIKNPEPDNYAGFMVTGTSIPDALESIYRYVCLDIDGKLIRDIPYVLRSSNMEIKCVGEFTPGILLDNNILMVNFYNA